jgi:integrase
MVGYLPNGKPDRRTVSGTTRKDVQSKVRALLAQKAAGRIAERAKANDTVEEYMKRWLDTIPDLVKGSTVYRYRRLVNGQVTPRLGEKKLSELKPDAVAAFYAERQQSGLSPTTVQLIHTTLRKALGDAVEYGYIAYNPVAGVKPPRRAEFEPRVLTSQEVQKLLAAAEEAGDRLTGLWWLLALTGARISEALTLHGRLSLGTARASPSSTHVPSTLTRSRSIVDVAKTARGRRVVSLDQDSLTRSGGTVRVRTQTSSGSARTTTITAWCSRQGSARP